MGSPRQSRVGLLRHDGGHSHLNLQKRKREVEHDCFIPSVVETSLSSIGYRKRSSWFRTERDRNALTPVGRCDGNVPGRGASLYHHAHRQMVERRFPALHQKAGGAILTTRRETNAHIPIVSNDPRRSTTCRLSGRPPSTQPPRQCGNAEEYWQRQVTAGAASVLFPLPLMRQ